MPEAAVYKNRLLPPYQGEVGPSAARLIVQAIAVPQPRYDSPDDEFGFRVGAAYGDHVVVAGRLVVNVQANRLLGRPSDDLRDRPVSSVWLICPAEQLPLIP